MPIHNKYASKKLKALAGAWIAFPLLYLCLCYSFFQVNAAGILKLLLSPWYWVLSVFTILSGVGLLQIRWYGWYLFVLSSFMAIYQTAIALTYYSDAPRKFPIFLAYALSQLLLILTVGREVRVPYYFPKIRWWESDPRYKLSVPAKVGSGPESSHGEILDISQSGCFIKTRAFFAADEKIHLQFSLFNQPIQCDGLVVWKTEGSVTHPKGIGVKFTHLGREHFNALRKATRKLKRLAQEYNQKTREKNWEEYVAREQQYQNKAKAGKK